MGVAYVIGGGLGRVGVVLIGMLVWRDQLTAWKVLGTVLIIAGSVLLNTFTRPTTQHCA